MADHNNQRAQKFDTSWSAANTQAVVLKGQNAKETALLENIRSLVVASIQDIYGTSEDLKYIYIVDLILKRIKQVLTDLNVSSDLQTIKDEVAKLKSSTSGSSDSSIEAILSKAEGKIESSIAEYFKAQKEEIDGLKTQISELVDTVKSAADEKPAEETTGEFSLPSDVSDQLSYISDSVEQLKGTLAAFAEIAVVKFSEVQTTIDARFSEITTTLSTIDKNLADSMSSTSKSFNDMSVKIEQSNSAILNAISRIQSNGNSSAIGAIGSSIVNGIAGITTGLLTSITSTMTALTTGLVSQVASTVQANQMIAKLDKIDSATVKTNEVTSKTLALVEVKTAIADKKQTGTSTASLPKVLTKPKLFSKLIAKHLFEYQRKHRSPTDQRVEELEYSIEGMFKNFKYSISQTFTSLNRFLKKGFKNITRSIGRLGSRLKSIAGATASGVSKVFQLILSPFGFMISGLFKMVSFIFKPISWLINFLKSPAFLLVIGAALLVFWPKIKTPIMNWFNKYIEPAFEKIKEVFMSDMPFFDKIKATLGILWDAIWEPFGGFSGFMKSMTKKLANLAKDVLWPFVKTKVWPYMKSHWKELLIGAVGFGVLKFLQNPMSAISLALKVPTAILNTIKLAQIAAKGVALFIRGIVIAMQIAQAALPALIAAAPLLLPALIVTAILGCVLASWIKDLRDAERELEETSKKGFDDAKKRGEEADANIKRNLEIVQGLKADNAKLFKKLDIKTADDAVPEEIMTADGRVTTVEFLQENVDKVSNITRNSTFDDAWQKINSKDLELDARGKEGIFARGFSKINAQLDAAFNFAKTFAADKLNHIGDKTLLQRHKVFVDMFNKERQAIGKELEFYNKEISETWSDGSDEDWEKKFEQLSERVVQWTKNALNYLTTNPDKAKGPVLNFSKVDEKGNVVAMTEAEQAAELKRYEAELAKASKEDRAAAYKNINKANWIARATELRAMEAVNSHDLERVHEMSNNSELMYQQTVQDLRNHAQERAAGETEKLLKDLNFALNDTKEDREMKEMITSLVKDQALLNLQESGGKDSRVTEEQQLKILALAREKIKEMVEKGEDLTPAQKKRYQAQLEALEKNKEMSAKLDVLISGQKKQTEEISKLETGTTNNNTMVAIAGGHAVAQQSKENVSR